MHGTTTRRKESNTDKYHKEEENKINKQRRNKWNSSLSISNSGALDYIFVCLDIVDR